MGGATAATPNASRRRIAVAVFALAALVGAASAAVAQTPVETARERAARLGQQVVNAHASVSELQRRILSLASDVTAARRRLDHLQGRLVEAEHDLARARADVASVNARLNERARQAFMTSGPGASAAYLLEADSFADLMDRTVMLDSVQRADTLLGAEAAIESSEMAVRQASLERATRRRTALLAQIESNQADLLGAFAAQQDALAQLAGQRRDALRDVRAIERRIARRAGALPFGDWAERFLRYLSAPTCRDNLVVVMAWQANEFTQARWNPLATTHRMHRSTSFNEVGVQNYVSLTQGVRASSETLTGGATSYGYRAILDALRRCDDAMATAEAIRASAWCRGCSNGGYVTELVPIVERYFERYTALHA